jgi:hypothetical protein
VDEDLDEIVVIAEPFWGTGKEIDVVRELGDDRPASSSRFKIAVTDSGREVVHAEDKVLVPSDHGLLKFPIKLAPILHRLSSEKAAVSVPEILSWQQEPNELPAKEVLATLKVLYSIGVLQKV